MEQGRAQALWSSADMEGRAGSRAGWQTDEGMLSSWTLVFGSGRPAESVLNRPEPLRSVCVIPFENSHHSCSMQEHREAVLQDDISLQVY